MDNNKSGDILYISELVHNFLEMSGSLSFSQHKQFWANLGNVDSSTSYFSVLIAKLIGIDMNDKSSSLSDFVKKVIVDNLPVENNNPINSKNQNDEAISLKQYLLNTLYFLALYYRFSSDNQHLRTALTKWSQTIQGEKGKLEPQERNKLDFADEILKMLTAASVEANDTIRIIDQCSNIDFIPSADFYYERFDAKLTAPSLLNFYLQSLLYREQTCKLIFETILLFLKHPLLSEKRMLSLLHMFKEYLIKAPRVPPEIISSALSIVKTYYLWPRPYGDVAREVLQLLVIEQKAPGATLRKRIFDENPELLKSISSPKTGRERTIHIIYDQGSFNSRTLQELLKAQVAPDISTHQLHINFLANIIMTCLNIDSTVMGLENLTKEDASKFYEAAFQILSEAVLMNQQDAEAYRTKELTSLKDEIVQFIEKTPKLPANLVMKAKPPQWPPLNFQFLPVVVDNTVSVPTSEEGSIPMANSANKLKYPKRPSMDILATIMGQYAAFANVKSKPMLKIAIIGGDSTIHNIVCSYACLKNSAPKSFEGLDLQFYIIPVEPSYFGGFLSRYDGWYARHVVTISRCVLKSFPCIALPQQGPGDKLIDKSKAASWNTVEVVDQISKMQITRSPSGTVATKEVNNTPKSLRMKPASGESNSSIFSDLKKLYDEDERPPTPGLVLRSELQNYFRDARWRLDVNIYQCECWGPEGTYVTAIPFNQRAEIGFRAYAKFIQKSNDIPDTATLSTISQHKAFKFNPPPLSIKYTQMNVAGIPKQGTPVEVKLYTSIVVANIPYQGDKGVPPNPSKPWLEMYASDYDPKKKKTKLPDKDLDIAPNSSYHVSMVDIEYDYVDKKKDKEKSFHILLDNVVYGPFSRIKIAAAQVNEEILVMPVMTFFPLDLPS